MHGTVAYRHPVGQAPSRAVVGGLPRRRANVAGMAGPTDLDPIVSAYLAEWLRRALKTESARSLAQRIGVTHATVSMVARDLENAGTKILLGVSRDRSRPTAARGVGSRRGRRLDADVRDGVPEGRRRRRPRRARRGGLGAGDRGQGVGADRSDAGAVAVATRPGPLGFGRPTAWADPGTHRRRRRIGRRTGVEAARTRARTRCSPTRGRPPPSRGPTAACTRRSAPCIPVR